MKTESYIRLLAGTLVLVSVALGHYVTVVKLGRRAAAQIQNVIHQASAINAAIANTAYSLLSAAKMTEGEYAYRLMGALAEQDIHVHFIAKPEKTDVNATGSGG